NKLNRIKLTTVEHIPGRVFFRCTSTLQQLMLLKSAERLFLLLRKAPPITLPKNPGVLLASYRCATNLNAQDLKRDEGEKEENSSESGQSRPTFRVSCRCSGAIARCYNSQVCVTIQINLHIYFTNLSRIIGVAISRQLGWKTDLRDPSIEVNVYLNDDHCVIGIPLLKHPLASRSYMKHTGLRSTVAWAMVSLCAVQEGSVILDPMCGVGTILLEASQECPVCTHTHTHTHTLLNINISLFAVAIPMPASSVDAVLCDVPFDRKFICSTDMTAALPHILAEMERVLRDGGHLVLLLSLQLSARIRKLIKSSSSSHQSHTADHDEESADSTHTANTHTSDEKSSDTKSLKLSSLVLQSTHRVSLGSTDALIHTYKKIHNTH
uniref:THUMP domain containing 2 n=1 Tax=Astyanax mexicanus TaxID=7994 RepID=A0A8B9KZR0_ASTMX